MTVSLHVVDEGSGSAVVLLHGFPDSSALWRHQIPVLVEAGYRVIVPDLRGFGASDRPADVDAYRLEASVADVLAILDQRGIERADVVGHDWGAALGWALAGFVPDRVWSLVAVSVGHPAGYFTDTLRQREMSWYMLFFLPPVACPVLGVSSDRDIACGDAQMAASRDHVTGPWRHHRIVGAGHWIPLAVPDELGKLMIDHLRGCLP